MIGLMLWLAATDVFAGPCVIDRVDTVITYENHKTIWTDRWVLGFEPGATDCRSLQIPILPELDVVSVKGRVRRPDRRTVRFGRERLVIEPGVFWTTPNSVLRMPDGDIGSTAEVLIQYEGVRRPFEWNLARLGPVAAASIEVAGGRLTGTEDADSMGADWSCEGCDQLTATMRVIPDSAGAVAGVAPADAAPLLMPVGDERAVILDRHRAPTQLVVPDDIIDLRRLTGEGLSQVRFAKRPASPTGEPLSECRERGVGWLCDVTPLSNQSIVLQPSSADAAQPLLQARVSLLPDTTVRLGRDEPPVGHHTVSGRWSGPAPLAPTGVVAPLGAEGLECHAGQHAGTRRGQVCRFPAGDGQARWSWRQPELPVAGELVARTVVGGRWESDIEAPEAELVWDAERSRSTPAIASDDDPDVLAVEDGRAPWRIRSVGNQPVLPNRAATTAVVARLALLASLPEPGLPVGFKNRLDRDDALEEVLRLVRRRVRAAPALSRGALAPRKLTAVLRAGWGTAWEQALLLTRYLRQLQIDALPVPVRPRHYGPGDAANPVGFDRAVVRVQTGQEQRWVVPACAVCAVNELPPEYSGAMTLSPELLRLPAATAGRVHVGPNQNGTVEVTLTGSAALWLRRRLLASRPADRLDALMDIIGAPDAAVLRDHHGLSTRGQAIRLQLATTAPFVGPPLPRVSEHGSAEVVLPWSGQWVWEGARPLPAHDGWSYEGISMSVDETTLTLSMPEAVVSRRAVVHALRRFQTDRSTLLHAEARVPRP